MTLLEKLSAEIVGSSFLSSKKKPESLKPMSNLSNKKFSNASLGKMPDASAKMYSSTEQSKGGYGTKMASFKGGIMNKAIMSAFIQEIEKQAAAAPRASFLSRLWSPGREFLETKATQIAKQKAGTFIPEATAFRKTDKFVGRLLNKEKSLKKKIILREGYAAGQPQEGLFARMRQRRIDNTKNKLIQHQGKLNLHQDDLVSKRNAMQNARANVDLRASQQMSEAQGQAKRMNFNRRIGLGVGAAGITGGGILAAKGYANRNAGYQQQQMY